jgi:hypothetical protein
LRRCALIWPNSGFNNEADVDAAIQIISDPKAQQGEARHIPTMNQRSTRDCGITSGHDP